jgi:hypothetical protein
MACRQNLLGAYARSGVCTPRQDIVRLGRHAQADNSQHDGQRTYLYRHCFEYYRSGLQGLGQQETRRTELRSIGSRKEPGESAADVDDRFCASSSRIVGYRSGSVQHVDGTAGQHAAAGSIARRTYASSSSRSRYAADAFRFAEQSVCRCVDVVPAGTADSSADIRYRSYAGSRCTQICSCAA